ncbi:hypothetical protein ACJMK2_002172 [Sinanodonta woodiana]|uniref:Uncharacterized protein n=1 Tax=Sinanodonta woodiana TaxID=1069815 RepID=A0ABD3XW93_SINWO
MQNTPMIQAYDFVRVGMTRDFLFQAKVGGGGDNKAQKYLLQESWGWGGDNKTQGRLLNYLEHRKSQFIVCMLQTVNCCECLKPRCIYTKTKLTARDQRALTHTLEKYDYTCGSVITPDGDILQGKVFVRLQLSYAVHIEFPYYASNIGRPDICAHCGAIGAEKSQEMTGRFRTVLPVCQQCLASGKVIPKRNPVKN